MTNAGASVGEDLAVAGVVALAIYHPWLALGVCTVLLAVGLVLVFVTFGKVRRGWGGTGWPRRKRFARRRTPP